jgi:hypothetical protein
MPPRFAGTLPLSVEVRGRVIIALFMEQERRSLYWNGIWFWRNAEKIKFIIISLPKFYVKIEYYK